MFLTVQKYENYYRCTVVLSMRRLILFTLLCLISRVALCQQAFTCEKIKNDWKHWEQLNATTKKTDFVAKALLLFNDSIFKPNQNSVIERVYVIQSEDTFNVQKLKDVVFDYFTERFKLDNEKRSQMVTNSHDNQVFFKGFLMNRGSYAPFGSITKLNCNILYDIRIKNNKIRISVRTEQYNAVTYSTANGALIGNEMLDVKLFFPFVQDSKHKKNYAMAYTLCTIDTWKEANGLFEYINSHVNVVKSVEDDW